jgi:hypothetical protein
MFTEGPQPPFDSIESARDFLNVLAETILNEIKDLNRDHQIAIRDNEQRRAQALALALFKLKNLSCHVHKARRNLNDLRMLRRLILDERATPDRELATL